jgi:hypothetical protein
MHQAWIIDDIWKLLLEHLTSHDLAVLARTNRAFFDLATSQLWHTLPSFSPFMHCLPLDHRHRPLQASDLERLDLYTTKVRVLSLEGKSADAPVRLPKEYQGRINKQGQKKNPGKEWFALWDEIAALGGASSTAFPRLRLRKLRINSADERLIYPLFNIPSEGLEQIYIKILHQRQTPSLVPKFLDSLSDVGRLEYLFVRDGQDLIPERVLRDAPLKHARFDPRIEAGRHDVFHYKTFPLRREVLHKETLEHLTMGLTRDWWTPALGIGEEMVGARGGQPTSRKFLPRLKTLWLNLTTFEAEAYKSHSPAEFLDALDRPKLDLLNIKFRYDATGKDFLSTLKAAKRSIDLEQATNLAIAGGGWFDNCPECGVHPAPLIKPDELRQALQIMLPLPQLKVLRISVAPNMLDTLDLDLYRSIAEQMPSLEVLHLGNSRFTSGSYFFGSVYHERHSLRNLAAFCNFLPKLQEVTVGAVDCATLGEKLHSEWACPNVERLSWYWINRGENGDDELIIEGLSTYFPNADMTKRSVEKVEQGWTLSTGYMV